MESFFGHGRHALDHLQFFVSFFVPLFFCVLGTFHLLLGHGRHALDHLQVSIYIIYDVTYTYNTSFDNDIISSASLGLVFRVQGFKLWL